MGSELVISDQLFQQLQASGEVRVEDTHGVPVVLMTIDARQQLGQFVYDDSDLTAAEMLAQGAEQLQDPTGWGAPEMDVYDSMEGIDQDANGCS
jgi:hypothetical protein